MVFSHVPRRETNKSNTDKLIPVLFVVSKILANPSGILLPSCRQVRAFEFSLAWNVEANQSLHLSIAASTLLTKKKCKSCNPDASIWLTLASWKSGFSPVTARLDICWIRRLRGQHSEKMPNCQTYTFMI